MTYITDKKTKVNKTADYISNYSILKVNDNNTGMVKNVTGREYMEAGEQNV
jgi:hypothetical protein